MQCAPKGRLFNIKWILNTIPFGAYHLPPDFVIASPKNLHQ